MRNIHARVSDPNDFVSNSGSRTHVTYSPVISETGSLVLVESGSIDSQDYIDSFADQTDMASILARLNAGDTSVLTSKTPFYADMTLMPKNNAEALQMVLDAEKAFDKLPLDIRNEFNNDFRQWFTQAGSDDFFKKMRIGVKDEIGIIEKDIVADSTLSEKTS